MTKTYGKLSGATLQSAPNPIVHNGQTMWNAPDEVYEADGWMEVVDTPYPTPVSEEDDRYYVAHWEEQDGKIVKVWEEAERPVPQPTLADRVVKQESITDYNLMTGKLDDPEEGE